MLKLKEVELILRVLQEAQETDEGYHWLPGMFAADLSQSIQIMKRELRAAKARDKLEKLTRK